MDKEYAITTSRMRGYADQARRLTGSSAIMDAEQIQKALESVTPGGNVLMMVPIKVGTIIETALTTVSIHVTKETNEVSAARTIIATYESTITLEKEVS